MKRYFMVAFRPGPRHDWYKHQDYGDRPGAAWQTRLIGPAGGGEFRDGEYAAVTSLRERHYEVVVTPLPTDWSEDTLDMGGRSM